jgi:hypothetical protein
MSSLSQFTCQQIIFKKIKIQISKKNFICFNINYFFNRFEKCNIILYILLNSFFFINESEIRKIFTFEIFYKKKMNSRNEEKILLRYTV